MLISNHREILRVESGLTDKSVKIFNVQTGKQGIDFKYLDLAANIVGNRTKLIPAILDKDNKKIRYLQPKGTSLTAFFPKSEIAKIKNEVIPLLVTEGEKKLMSLYEIGKLSDYAKLSFPGAWNWGSRNDNGVLELSNIWQEIPVKNREVFLVPDTDYFTNYNVFSGYEKFISLLCDRGAIIQLVDLRIGKDKIGVDEFILNKGNNELIGRIQKYLCIYMNFNLINILTLDEGDQIKALATITADAAVEHLDRLGKQGDKAFNKIISSIRFSINMSKPLKEKNNEIFREPKYEPIYEFTTKLGKLIGKIENLFRNSTTNSLIYIKDKIATYLPTSKELNPILSNLFTYRRVKRDKEGLPEFGDHTHIPIDDVTSFMASGSNFDKIKQIDYVSRFPIVENGILLSKHGYHRDYRFYYLGDEIIPDKKNLSFLWKTLDSFAFQTDIDKYNFLGILISLFDRHKFIGEYPMPTIQGDQQSLGKSTLMEVFSLIAEDKEATMLSLADENETIKQTVSCLMNDNIIVFDNLKGRVNNSGVSSPFLEKAVTSKMFTQRKLGGNANFVRPNNFTIGFTLNGGKFSADLLVRQLIISLHSSNAGTIDFDFNVMEFTKNNRLKIISGLAFLRLQKNDSIAVDPIDGIGKFKFIKFANYVNRILVSNNIQGFLSNQEELKTKSDPFIVALLDLLHDKNIDTNTFTPKQLITVLPDDLFEEVSIASQRASWLGRQLSPHIGKILGSNPGYKVEKSTSGNNTTYRFIKEGGAYGPIH